MYLELKPNWQKMQYSPFNLFKGPSDIFTFLKIILDHLKATRDLSWDLWVPWRKDLCTLTQPFNIDLGTYLQRRDDIAAERKVQTAYISCSKTLFSYNAKEKRGWVKISSRCLTQSHFNWNLTFIQCTVTKIARVVFLNSVLYYINYAISKEIK